MGQLPYLFAQCFPENIEPFDTRTLQRLLDTLATRPSDLQKTWSHKGQGSWVEQRLVWRAENSERATRPPLPGRPSLSLSKAQFPYVQNQLIDWGTLRSLYVVINSSP